MTISSIAILYPGEMGHNVALVLREHDLRVVSFLEERSKRTRALAAEAGIEALPSLEEVARQSDLILSILVPSAALPTAIAVSKAMAQARSFPLYVDCNAISPLTARAIAQVVEEQGGRFVDANIIGSARRLRDQATFYCSGSHAADFARLAGFGLKVEVIGQEIGQASAFKMLYAGLTKGMSSLAVELLLGARAMGLLEEIMRKYHADHPGVAALIEHLLPGLPFRAGRRSEEMEELALTLQHYGIEPAMARGSRQVLKSIGDLKLADKFPPAAEKGWTYREVAEMLGERLASKPGAR